MNKVWSDTAWNDYLWWELHDRKILQKINRLIKDCEREPYAGLGKPESLRGDLSGSWSRRIDDKNRLVYQVTGQDLLILSCKGHYGEK